MANQKWILTAVFSCLLGTAFANTIDQENQIATACKPYLERYNPQQDPNSLPAAAQAALTACSDHGSCQTSILSGIPDCAIKLNALQPNQTPPLSVIQDNPAAAPTAAAPTQPTNTWGLPSAAPTPGATPQQAPTADTAPTDTTSDADTAAASPPPVTPPAPPAPPATPTPPAPTQPQNDQSTTPNINWF